MLAIHDREAFDACIPVLDSALLAFTRAWEDAFARRFAVGMSPRAAVDIAADKMELWRRFETCRLPTPETWPLPEFLASPGMRFPCFLKPRYSEIRDFGDGVYCRLDDQADVEHWARKLGHHTQCHVVQPFLEGREINVNFFCDAGGDVRSIVPIARLAGEPGGPMTRGEILDDSRFDPLVRKVAEAIPLWGSNELQVFVAPDGGIQCTELNVRLNGGSHFLQAAGVDHFANLLRLIRGEPVSFPNKPHLLKMTSWDTLHAFVGSPLRSAAV